LDKLVVCRECFGEFEKWLLLQAKRDASMKYRQTKAYDLWQRFINKQDIEVREAK